MLRSDSSLRLIIFSILLHHSYAFWRMPCLEMAFGRIDPIVQPGIVSGHVHTVVGGASKFSESSLRDVWLNVGRLWRKLDRCHFAEF